ncbi:LysR family transcriptional regulator ArgP [Rhizobium halophytocola]|uniref:LysR family transcriptional regulator (Chromosome initiation inhibitor) n=1 Tax=Rhizobium halophytocola TaxID=735519 RepID=A0ABS4E5S6_9HYPH|nr:LysR family transcriptional regulator ArgP [Rhizobium halophytocola]MBP1853258.1 LysR family transcriptional regulator (chromosome initiation inhibitor) [Rhizobium halophytocola]
MLDYQALKAVAAVIRTGSFDKAARLIHVTPSAVSQRVKQLEERMGAVLVVRGSPCTATETGDWLCRHVEQVELMEGQLFDAWPALSPAADGPERVTLSIAVNADSLGTWFLEALQRFSKTADCLFDLAVDDQEHTAERLRRGQVAAAVTSLEQPIQGCRRIYLGRLRYHATASPDFMARHFAGGVDAHSLGLAPALTFDRKDRLQQMWLAAATGGEPAIPTHWLPSTQGFVEAALRGLGWGMNPAALVAGHLADGRLVELIPGKVIDVPLYWQISRLASAPLAGLTEAVRAAAAEGLETEDRGQGGRQG